jgi:hypothetical protein
MMSPRRLVLLVTVLAAAGLLVWLTAVSWDSASKIATIVVAVATVAMLGVALWAGLAGSGAAQSSIRAIRTGPAMARGKGSVAVTGVKTSVGKAADRLEANRTENATADDGAEATSGIKAD